MDKRDALRSMLNNMINDKKEEASLDFHTYLTAKMRDVTGMTNPDQAPVARDDYADADNE